MNDMETEQLGKLVEAAKGFSKGLDLLTRQSQAINDLGDKLAAINERLDRIEQRQQLAPVSIQTPLVGRLLKALNDAVNPKPVGIVPPPFGSDCAPNHPY